MNEKIPLARPYVGEEEVAAVSSVIRSGQLSMGQKVKEFENSFAAYLGRKYAISVNSGTSGLQLCLQALNLKPGDEVITSSFSFVASSNPIIFAGAKPVFVDIDERTFNIDPKKIEQAITTRTKAIVLVHLFGNSADMDAINVIADKYNLIIVEDACEALGTRYKDRKVGSLELPLYLHFILINRLQLVRAV
jgi:perosamine synthetase